MATNGIVDMEWCGRRDVELEISAGAWRLVDDNIIRREGERVGRFRWPMFKSPTELGEAYRRGYDSAWFGWEHREDPQ